MISKSECEMIATATATTLIRSMKDDDEFLERLGRIMSKNVNKPKTKPVSAKVAADILGISVRQLRRIKDNFSYSKTGTTQQSGLVFNANTLMDEYQRYIANRRVSV